MRRALRLLSRPACSPCRKPSLGILHHAPIGGIRRHQSSHALGPVDQNGEEATSDSEEYARGGNDERKGQETIKREFEQRSRQRSKRPPKVIPRHWQCGDLAPPQPTDDERAQMAEKMNEMDFTRLLGEQADNHDGSAAMVASLLLEMESLNIKADAGSCHAALRALGVHPNPILRHAIVDYMRNNWISLDDLGWHDIAAGYIKEANYEKALDQVDGMRASNVPVRAWLLDMMMLSLCEAGELDSVAELLFDRNRRREFMLTDVWYYVFDTACTHLHYSLISFAWQQQVQTYSFNPSDGQCLAALTAASRHGDVQLARDIFEKLSTRQSPTDSIHYELLLGAYLRQDDIVSALNVARIMCRVFPRNQKGSLREFFLHITQSPALVLETLDQAIKMYEERTDRNDAMPSAIMGLIIEAALTLPPAARADLVPPDADHAEHYLMSLLSSREDADVRFALDAYLRLKPRCNIVRTDTFNDMLARLAAHKPGNWGYKETAMFIAAEMVARDVAPTAGTYDALIAICTADAEFMTSVNHSKNSAASLRDAMRYTAEMDQAGFKLRLSTVGRLVAWACRRKDTGAWVLMEKLRRDHSRGGGEAYRARLDELARWLADNWPGSERPAVGDTVELGEEEEGADRGVGTWLEDSDQEAPYGNDEGGRAEEEAEKEFGQSGELNQAEELVVSLNRGERK